MATKRITSLEEDFKKIGLFLHEDEDLEPSEPEKDGAEIPGEDARFATQKTRAPKLPGKVGIGPDAKGVEVAEEEEPDEEAEPQEEWNFDKKGSDKADDDDEDSDDADDDDADSEDDSDDDDDDKDEDIDEAKIVMLRKKTGAKANLKRRMGKLYDRTRKAKKKRDAKIRRRKPATKMKMKLRARLTKGLPKRQGVRTVLKMGTERVSNLLEKVEAILDSISPFNRGEFVKAFANIAIISQTLSEKFNEAAQELKNGDLWESAKVMEELAEEAAKLAEEVNKPNSVVYKTDLETTFGEAIQSVLEGLELYETMYDYPTYGAKGDDLSTYEPLVPGHEMDKSELPDDADMDAAKDEIGTEPSDPSAPYKKLADLGPEGAQIRSGDKTDKKGTADGVGSRMGKRPGTTTTDPK